MSNPTLEYDVTDFYGKLLHCESNSGKMRWNAICEDLVSIYESKFDKNNQKIDPRELWTILFEPEQKQVTKKNTLIQLFKTQEYRTFFMETLYVGLEDPKEWSEWTTHYRY